MAYKYVPRNLSKIIVAGCGGTGSLVAEGLCRLFYSRNAKIILIDYDRIEPHNLFRQSFYPKDLGKFKSQVLAERLSRAYGRPITYSVWPFERDMVEVENGSLNSKLVQNSLIIGCVDGAQGRRSIAEAMVEYSNCWIDAGNGYQSGQVLIGDAPTTTRLEGSFTRETNLCEHLPTPAFQLPTLLTSDSVKKQDCAEDVASNRQSPTINMAMAMLVLQTVHKLITNELTYMGAYIDIGLGTMNYISIDPVTIARIFSMKEESLYSRKERIA